MKTPVSNIRLVRIAPSRPQNDNPAGGIPNGNSASTPAGQKMPGGYLLSCTSLLEPHLAMTTPMISTPTMTQAHQADIAVKYSQTIRHLQ